MKKLLAMLLAVIMVLSLCACQNTPAETTESTTKSTTAPTSGGSTEGTTEPADLSVYPIVKEGDEPITVKGAVFGFDTSMSEDRTVWQKVEEITGINIEWEVLDKEAMTTYLAGNEWPDFFLSNLDPSLINDYGITGGRFANLLDYLEYMPNLQKTFEDYPLAKPAATELNGEMYKFVSINDAVTAVYSRPMYRSDLPTAAGITEMPKTVEEFKEMLIAIKDLTGEAVWVPDYNTEQVTWCPQLYTAFGTGVDMLRDIDENGQIYFARTSEQYKHYLEYMHELYELGLIHPEAASVTSAVRKEMEMGGKICLLEEAQGSLQAEHFENGEIQLQVIPPLTSQYDSTQTYMGRSPVIFMDGPIINAESEYIVELCKMFDILYATEEVVEGSGLWGMSFTYGLENVDWHFTETSYVQTTPEGVPTQTYLYGEAIWTNQGRCDAFATFVTETPGNNQVRQQGFKDFVIPYEGDDYIWNFVKFTEDEQYIIDNTLADIQAYYQAKHVEFITGVADIEADWESYCAEFQKMRVDELIAVYQAAYDRFMAAA